MYMKSKKKKNKSGGYINGRGKQYMRGKRRCWCDCIMMASDPLSRHVFHPLTRVSGATLYLYTHTLYIQYVYVYVFSNI